MANKDPSVDTRFKKGVSGNPGGKTKAQKATELKAAEIAAKMRLKALSSMQTKFLNKTKLTDEDLDRLLSSGALALFKQSEDRAHGTPKQYVDNISSDGTMSPTKIIRELVYPNKTKEEP
tara:strand:- start:3337 stop:3696 length:360 start_codon:yes stop_codon:yes gene_type:complete